MDLGKLKAFITVAEELNFRKSAEILGMSQPPLTRLIAALEAELETPLFERTTRTVKLTGAGVFLLKEGREMLAHADRLEKEIRSVSKMKSGELRVGFSQATFIVTLPKILSEFESRYPKIKISFHQGTSDALIKMLKGGKVDIAFIEGQIQSDGLAHHVVKDERLGVLVPKKHPLAKKKNIELADLKGETVILHPRRETRGFYDSVLHLFAKHSMKPRTYIKKDGEQCPILVATGRGLSLTIAGGTHAAFPGVTFVPLRNLTLPVSALWDSENENASLKSFRSFVIESPVMRDSKFECLMDVMRL